MNLISLKLKRIFKCKGVSMLPRWCGGKYSVSQCRRQEDADLIPGSRRFPGAGNGKPLQNSCLENSMEKEAGCIVHGIAKLDTTEHTRALMEKYWRTCWKYWSLCLDHLLLLIDAY